MSTPANPAVAAMWWCPTCQQRIPQPRWMNMGKPTQRSYHLLGTIDHSIERVPVLDGELVKSEALNVRTRVPVSPHVN